MSIELPLGQQLVHVGDTHLVLMVEHSEQSGIFPQLMRPTPNMHAVLGVPETAIPERTALVLLKPMTFATKVLTALDPDRLAVTPIPLMLAAVADAAQVTGDLLR